MSFGSNSMMLLAIAFSVVFPLGLLIWWKVKTHAGLWSFITGGICFFVFAMILEQVMHYFFLNPQTALGAAVTGSAVLYMLYGAFAAGIFEETGRLVGFKLLLRKHRDPESAIAYGIGHGGIEVFLVLGTTYLLYVLAKAGVVIGTEEATAALLQTANAIPASVIPLAMLERIFAVILHIGLSMIMFVAAKQPGRLYLYPVSICLHALADMPACLYQFGILKSLVVVEGFTLVYGVIIFVIGRRSLKAYCENRMVY